MSTSDARINANRANAARSTGPKTEEGKARSRANSLKHGLTGDGVVLPEEDAARVEELSRALSDELKAEGEVGHALARRMAVMTVRMDRGRKKGHSTIPTLHSLAYLRLLSQGRGPAILGLVTDGCTNLSGDLRWTCRTWPI